jgi:hypothetical protein
MRISCRIGVSPRTLEWIVFMMLAKIMMLGEAGGANV